MRPHNNCYKVADVGDGELWAGEYPFDIRRQVGVEKLRAHLDFGFTAFVDLSEPGELISYVKRLPRKVVYKNFPIVDLKTPPLGSMRVILTELDQLLRDGNRVYLHCMGGVGRTGCVVGCWLVEHGHTGAGALAYIAEKWRSMEKIDRRPRSPETDAQCVYVRSFRRSTRRRPAI